MGILYQKSPKFHITVITKNSGELRQLMDHNVIDLAILSRLSESNEGVVIYQTRGVWVAKNMINFQQRPLPLAFFEPSCKFHSAVIDGLGKVILIISCFVMLAKHNCYFL
jgi:hypothetical protein